VSVADQPPRRSRERHVRWMTLKRRRSLDHIKLDRTLPVPLYYQLMQQLAQEIERGGWQPGDFFTTEEQLQERLGISRATVRKALEELMDRGLLERITGKGTFIARPPLKITLPHLISFSEEILAQGMRPGTRVLRVQRVPAPKVVLEALQLADGPVLCVTRLRKADGQPLVYMQDYLHPRLGLTEADSYEGSLYTILETSANVRVEEAVHQINAVRVEGEAARCLEVPEGEPGLRFIRISYDQSGRPLVYEEAICRGDRYTYSIRLRRKGGLL